MRCPVGKVRDALALHDAQSQRQRGLPHEVLVYFVLAMVLYASVAYEAEMGSYEQSELTLAGSVMAHADATMLITADRNFYSYAFWQQSLATGARLLFRLSSVLKLPREKILADGSYLSTIYSSTQDRKKGRGGIRVRIIEYTLDGIPDAEPSYRLTTNWMDPTEAPALELAALYHRRWTIESSLDELKTHLADRQVVLRSKRPELVEQEFYALLLAHAAVRHLMTEAADQTGQAAEDLSFIHAIRVLHRRLPAAGSIPPLGIGQHGFTASSTR